MLEYMFEWWFDIQHSVERLKFDVLFYILFSGRNYVWNNQPQFRFISLLSVTHQHEKRGFIKKTAQHYNFVIRNTWLTDWRGSFRSHGVEKLLTWNILFCDISELWIIQFRNSFKKKESTQTNFPLYFCLNWIHFFIHFMNNRILCCI